MFTGIFGVLVLVLDIIAIIDIVGGRGSAGHKILWFLIVFFLPVIGMAIYFLIGKNKALDL
jgi:hypothetical protein